MATDLTGEIISDIGFPKNISDYNGTTECGAIKKKAIEKLPGVIENYNQLGEPIDHPNKGLIKVLQRIANEEAMTTFATTLQAARYVIRTHIDYANLDPVDKEKAYRNAQRKLENEYILTRNVGVNMIGQEVDDSLDFFRR